MSPPRPPSAPILVASDSSPDANLVKNLLAEEFAKVVTSTQPEKSVEDFEEHQPKVLVLAFGVLEKAEAYYLGLFRRGGELHRQPHRTIILCNKEEVRRVYERCRAGIFDDYVLFWPLTNDAPRLPMAVHHALREVTQAAGGGPEAKTLAPQLHSLAELDALLQRGMAEGDLRLEETARIIAQARQDIGLALHGFSRHMVEGGLAGLVDVRNAPALEQAFDRLHHDSIEGPLHAVAESVQPLKHLAGEFRQASAPHLEALRTLQVLTEPARPTLLVVDDDPFQHKLVGRLLKDLDLRLVFAASGLEALNLLRKVQPDLILMDYSMPEMDGLEVTRRIKGMARFAPIPIIMITGNSEEHVVTESLQAGANDFMVKPLGAAALTAKISKLLGSDTGIPSKAWQDLNQSDF